tara:strand:- start:244 stop:1095 length:852 start_codon:yes stop_codon:yes gene_type:complete
MAHHHRHTANSSESQEARRRSERPAPDGRADGRAEENEEQRDKNHLKFVGDLEDDCDERRSDEHRRHHHHHHHHHHNHKSPLHYHESDKNDQQAKVERLVQSNTEVGRSPSVPTIQRTGVRRRDIGLHPQKVFREWQKVQPGNLSQSDHVMKERDRVFIADNEDVEKGRVLARSNGAGREKLEKKVLRIDPYCHAPEALSKSVAAGMLATEHCEDDEFYILYRFDWCGLGDWFFLPAGVFYVISTYVCYLTDSFVGCQVTMLLGALCYLIDAIVYYPGLGFDP